MTEHKKTGFNKEVGNRFKIAIIDAMYNLVGEEELCAACHRDEIVSAMIAVMASVIVGAGGADSPAQADNSARQAGELIRDALKQCRATYEELGLHDLYKHTDEVN